MTNLENQIENANVSLQNAKQQGVNGVKEIHMAQAVASCILALQIISEELNTTGTFINNANH